MHERQPTDAIVALVEALTSPDELFQLVRLGPDGRALYRAWPEPRSVTDLLQTLAGSELAERRFFERLLAIRPRRGAEIQAAYAGWRPQTDRLVAARGHRTAAEEVLDALCAMGEARQVELVHHLAMPLDARPDPSASSASQATAIVVWAEEAGPEVWEMLWRAVGLRDDGRVG